MSNILFVEDDPGLAFAVTDQLSLKGYEVNHVTNGEEAWKLIQNVKFNIILVDVMMPKMDGFSLVKKIREKDDVTPILFLTARSQQDDKLKGFEIGADDYITKPFSIEELDHRVKVFLRRTGHLKKGSLENIQLGKFQFDINNLRLSFQETSFELTRMESDLLKLLLENKNQLVKRSEILIEIWGEDDYFKGRSLDVFVSRIRKYLKSDPSLELKNHHGVGFSLIDHK